MLKAGECKMSEGQSYVSDIFLFDRSVYESVKKDDLPHGVLRGIKGPVAEWGGLNRNTRKYSERLWDKVLATPYLVEQLKYHSLFGEANHPTDRYEVDFARVSHSITDMWKVPDKNQIWAIIYILDTPLGRILNTLYDSGSLLGYSSRAGGLLHQRKDYIEVDEDTYNFVTFDAVPYPSVECARPGVMESAEFVKMQLSEEVHNKLISMINESAGSVNREVIKEFIYNLRGYDLSKEKAVFESTLVNTQSNPVNPSVKAADDGNDKNSDDKSQDDSAASKVTESVRSEGSNPNEKTTLSLLQESTQQIDRMKVNEQALIATRDSLIKENVGLKESLNTALLRVSSLMEEAKREEEINNQSNTASDDTIREMRNRIEELEGDLDEKESELEELRSVREAAKALKYENSRLKNGEAVKPAIQLRKQQVDPVSNDSEIEDLKAKLSEAYSEITRMVDESGKREDEIADLEDEVQELKLIRASLMKANEQLERELDDSAEELEKANDKIEEGVSRFEDVSERATALEGKNSKLRGQLDSANESVDVIRKQLDRCKRDLVSVICGSYNISEETVRSHLKAGFDKSDVYEICEGLSREMSQSYPQIIGEYINSGSNSGYSNPVSSGSSLDQVRSRVSIVNRRGFTRA